MKITGFVRQCSQQQQVNTLSSYVVECTVPQALHSCTSYQKMCRIHVHLFNQGDGVSLKILRIVDWSSPLLIFLGEVKWGSLFSKVLYPDIDILITPSTLFCLRGLQMDPKKELFSSTSTQVVNYGNFELYGAMSGLLVGQLLSQPKKIGFDL